jgi:broad specificity phosphatase PhoE
MKTVYLVRHGQCMGNLTSQWSAPSDVLTTAGLQQAKEAAHILKEKYVQVLLTSHYTRAVQTAEEIFAVTGAHMEIVETAAERKHGSSLFNMPRNEPVALEQSSEEDAAWTAGLPAVHDEETYVQFQTRVSDMLRILASRPENTLALVTHDFFLKGIYCALEYSALFSAGEIFELATHAYFPNGSISCIEFDQGVWRPKEWALNKH